MSTQNHDPADFEKLGAFYLGREVDAKSGQDHPEPLLIDARDLTTHAVCVGMTGSGKTGLCLGLIEEAAIDGVPVLCIDPKGDIADLLLTFPKMEAADFLPWVDAAEAARRSLTRDALAEQTAAAWKQGLADWGQQPERIQRLRDAAEVSVYTPGGGPGLALSVLRSLDPPAQAQGEGIDAGARAESINAVVAALLALLKIEADPVRGRESILLARIVGDAWTAGQSLDLTGLIRAIQKPGFEQLGAFDLETFYPAKDRMDLAMAVNSLLASPGFSAWTSGETLDVQRLLYTAEGKPRICIVSISHLGDAERMFVVTLLLNALVGWMRRQSGTSSLRALLYMDEIFGYFPPTANPPSKGPMLTLLKQARAFGLGCLLATQNPVDLDYRGLANCGTWLIGRLQTERDKARVIEGLTSALGGNAPDKGALENLMSSLRQRLFLMRRAADDAPRLIRSRWTLSWLRGPLTATELGQLMAPQKARAAAGSAPGATSASAPAGAPTGARPVLPPGVREIFLPATSATPTYRLAILWSAKLHYVDAAHAVDAWQAAGGLALPPAEGRDPDWQVGASLAASAPPAGTAAPVPLARFEAPPASALRAASWDAWSKSIGAALYQEARSTLQYCAAAKAVSNPGEDAGAFRARLSQSLREQRDHAVDDLTARYAPKLAALQQRLAQAQARAQVQHSQATAQTVQAAVAVGATILGALFGRKTFSATTVQHAATAMRSATRIGEQRQEASQADESVAAVQQQIDALQAESAAAIAELKARLDPAALPMEALNLAPRKGDISVGELLAAWVPA